MKTIVNATSKKVAEVFLLFMNNTGKHTNGNAISFGNTQVRKENNAITVTVGGKPIVTATPDADSGEYTYLLEPRNSTALNRIVGLKDALDWEFDLVWVGSSPFVLVIDETGQEKTGNIISIGALSRRTVEELTEIARTPIQATE